MGARELPANLGGWFLLVCSFCIFFSRRGLRKKSIEARRKIGGYDRLEMMFEKFDEDRDSLLSERELSKLFESMDIYLWSWQKELLLLEYDSQILGGLRLEDFT